MKISLIGIMAGPMISIFCSVYNREGFIEETILSVLNQSYPYFEFLIVDDGSKDNSLYIIKKYAKTDNRIKIFVNYSNKGLWKVYNFLLKQVNPYTQYICWVDSDDKYTIDNLEKRVEIVKRFGELDGVINNLQPIDINGNFLDYNRFFFDFFSFCVDKTGFFVKDINYLLDKFLRVQKKCHNFGLPLSYGSIMVKKKILLKEGIINPTRNDKYFIGDFDLLCRLLKGEYKVRYIRDKILLYRQHPGQSLKVKKKQVLKDLISTSIYLYKIGIIKNSILKSWIKFLIYEVKKIENKKVSD